MASNFHIQKPYVLASLPRSVAQVDGKAVVGEVYGQRPGVKKRRRAEVSVGIDGEAANIYDIASSRLITSYPVPPQAKFSCAPCSVRLRSSAGKEATVARYTYIATREPARKLSLFKDTVEASGNTLSETATASLGRSGEVVSLHSLSLVHSAVPDVTSTAAPIADLLAIDQDGQLTCFDGASLKEKYKVSVAGLAPDLVPRGATLKVEFAQLGLAGDVVKGLGLGEDYVSGYFSQRVNAEAANGFNPDVLFVVSTVTSRHTAPARYLHLLAVDPSRQGSQQHQAALVQMHYIRLPAPASVEGAAASTISNYRLDVASGSLLAMEGDKVLSYDLARSLPRVASQISIAGVSSFLRLSKSSILASTPSAFSVYNPLFQSLQASTEIDVEATTKSGAPISSGKSAHACSFVSYFPQLELAVALLDSNLVAVQLEPPRTRSRKRRADGLLIDSIGRGMSYADGKVIEDEHAVLSKLYLPGTVSANYVSQLKDDIQAVDALIEQNDTVAFDDFVAEKLGIQSISDWRWQRPLDVGDAMEEDKDGETAAADDSTTDDAAATTVAPATSSSSPPPSTSASGARRHKYPETDRRWVLYAINRIITIADQSAGERLRFHCKLPSSDILNYLVDAGHLSVANTHSALREQLRDFDDAELLLGEALPLMLAQVDPSLDLLVRWLYETKLSATELLSAILLLMRSLELVENTAEKSALKLLTNGTEAKDGSDAEDANSELDQLDQQLHLAEYFLQQVENDPRDLALDIAIGKLGNCPAVTTVSGLRRIFRTDEIRALIEVLRKQMVDQGWATRYMDMEGEADSDSGSDDDKEAAAAAQAPLNYSIRLIADLMARCIDAVRPGEWLINDEEASPMPLDADAPSAGGDFFAQLKWQVSAALEGVQEALYLRGIVGETVRYGMSLQRAAAAADNHSKAQAGAAAAGTALSASSSARPARVNTSQSSTTLPIGMNAPSGTLRHPDVTRTKMVSANEVAKRTRREVGHLTSKKVGPYTLERIVF